MSVKLRQEANGRQCTVRLPGICNRNPETTVLAHMNEKSMFGVGMGQKVDDLFACFACSDCHDAIDHRVKTEYTREELYTERYTAVLRTQNILLKEGKIGVLK